MNVWIETSQLMEDETTPYSYGPTKSKPVPGKFCIKVKCSHCQTVLLSFVAGDGKDGFLGGLVPQEHECPVWHQVLRGSTS